MLAEARRRELLGALGIDLYVPRGVPAAGRAALVVICAEAGTRSSGGQHLRRVLPSALGVDASRIVWVAQEEAALPPAAACVVFGALPAGAHDAQLSTMRQNGGMIVRAEQADVCLANPGAKRALWQALKPVARHLRGAG